MTTSIIKKSSKLSAHTLPKRLSLVDEVTTIIRDGISSGRWHRHLPGERQLSAELRVSRPTVKRAVEVLAEEGLVSNIGRFRRQILKIPKTKKSQSNIVATLISIPLEKMEPHFLIRMDYLRAGLAMEGLDLHIIHAPRCFSSHPDNALDELLKEHDVIVWLLVRSTQQMQKWFDEKKIPALIMGTEFDGVHLYSIDNELAPVSRHAAGLLAARGHVTIGFVMSQPYCAGDVASREAFIEGAKSVQGHQIKAIILEYDGSKQSLCALLDRHLRTSVFPTGFLLSHATTAVTMVSHLAQRGKVVGRDYAYICREDDPLLEHLTPEAAHYKFDFVGYSRRVLDFVKKIAQNRRVTQRHLRMMPEFVDGASLDKLS